MNYTKLERAAYISGNTALADLYAQLDDNAQTIERQEADLENLRYQLREAESCD
jgi:hypothetical protein